uniref:Putative secreted salivary protein n=1 Tax=Ixodes scapularis TaxID=6945 RepID=Q4PN24_IXOSC|nr:putative secreted salivary protein [Ixodes scapularis]
MKATLIAICILTGVMFPMRGTWGKPRSARVRPENLALPEKVRLDPPQPLGPSQYPKILGRTHVPRTTPDRPAQAMRDNPKTLPGKRVSSRRMTPETCDGGYTITDALEIF